MFTDVPARALSVLVADCAPVLLADPEARIVGAAHAAREGMAAGWVNEMLTAMSRAVGGPPRVARVIVALTLRAGGSGAGVGGVGARIAAAGGAAGGRGDEVTLIAVTKTRPVSDIRLLRELGVRDIGENKDQEAAPKAAASAALGLDLAWHFVGQLQTNKAASVVSYAQVIHSVDRLRLGGVLCPRASAARRTMTCLA